MDIFDAAERYHSEGRSLIVLAGKDYGSGSSRDWAAKGPWMLVREGEGTCVEYVLLVAVVSAWEHIQVVEYNTCMLVCRRE